MARIRTIKPEFWTDGDMLGISRDARLFYIGLWNFVDDNGVIEDNEKSIKAKIFPCDDINISKLLKELESTTKILKYVVNNKPYILLKNLKNHQLIDRPRKSNLPLPDSFNGNQLKSTEIMSISKDSKDSSETHEILKTYCELFKERYKKNPVITAKDSGIAKRIALLPLEAPLSFSILLQRFFDSKDKFIVQNRHSLNILESQTNKLLVDKEDWRDG